MWWYPLDYIIDKMEREYNLQYALLNQRRAEMKTRKREENQISEENHHHFHCGIVWFFFFWATLKSWKKNWNEFSRELFSVVLCHTMEW